MTPLVQILTVHTVKDLFRYRSFFILIFALLLLDRVVHPGAGKGLAVPSWHQIAASTAVLSSFVFNELPAVIAGWVVQWRTWLILLGLFLLKQLISMWPSSDMRRMHRNERGGFGLFGALSAIGWHQVVWDAIAIISLCWALGLMAFLASPLTLAGFSYSSKLAVLSRGSFGRKLGLFFSLFTNRILFLKSWCFYLLRQIIEMTFVAALPMVILLSIPQPWIRILLAGVVATPVYSYLKMASFKFFLYVYAAFPEVRSEYDNYYHQLAHPGAHGSSLVMTPGVESPGR